MSSTSTERVFIIGGTGAIGTKTVNDLLDNQVAVTLFTRSPEKVSALFPNRGDLVNVLQGDFTDLSPIKEGIKGHTRLLLLVADLIHLVEIKKTIATFAYDAGVQQIVDISSYTVNQGWRESPIGTAHYYGEKAVFDIPNRGHFVALRPDRFMSNLLRDRSSGIYSTASLDFRQGLVSPNDIGAVAAVVLREDVNKHGDAVYNLTGDIFTPRQQVELLERLLGKQVPYHQISSVDMYKKLMQFGAYSHSIVVTFSDAEYTTPHKITPCIEILLGRKPQTTEEYLTLNKHLIL